MCLILRYLGCYCREELTDQNAALLAEMLSKVYNHLYISEAMSSGPFASLNQEELSQARRDADAAMDRQRTSMEPSESAAANTNGNSSILMGPKPTDKVTVGHPWGSEDADTVKPRGLTQSGDGWFYACEYDDCASSWRTNILPEGQFGALVEMYKLHVDQCHEKKKSSADQEKHDKEQESYKEAIKLRTIESHQDNRMDVLSPARFLPMPLRHEHIAKLQPVNQLPVWDRINLSHVGVHLADTAIIKKLHNRSYAGAQLKYFSTPNLGIVETDKELVLRPSAGGMKQTSNFKSITTIPEAVGALLNCEAIWRHLHPCDYGTYALVRFLLDKIHHVMPDRKLTSVTAVSCFFQAAFKGNADRVLSPEGPRTYQELVTFYNSMDWSSQNTSSNSGYSKPDIGKRSGQKRNAEGVKVEKRDSKKDVAVCYAFNSPGGCSKSSGRACRNGYGKEFKHCCSHVEASGFLCGAEDHGRHGHV